MSKIENFNTQNRFARLYVKPILRGLSILQDKDKNGSILISQYKCRARDHYFNFWTSWAIFKKIVEHAIAVTYKA